MKDNLVEKEALFTCFITLTSGKSNSLDFEEFEELMDYVYHKQLKESQKRKIFSMMDSNNKGSISISQFLQSMDIIHSNPKLVAYDYEFFLWKKIRYFFNHYLYIRPMIKHPVFEIVIVIILIINSIIIGLTFIGLEESWDDLLVMIDRYFIYVYILEAVLKIIGLGFFDYFRDNWNKLDFSLIIITLSTDVAFSMFKFIRNARSARASKLVSSVRMKNALKVSRSFKSIKVKKFTF